MKAILQPGTYKLVNQDHELTINHRPEGQWENGIFSREEYQLEVGEDNILPHYIRDEE